MTTKLLSELARDYTPEIGEIRHDASLQTSGLPPEPRENPLEGVTLEELCRTSPSAPYHVHSADVELGGKATGYDNRESVPASLRNYVHGGQIFDFIREPSTDLSLIGKRQACINILLEQPHLRQIVESKNASLEVIQGIARFFQDTEDEVGHKMTVLHAYRSGTSFGENVASNALRSLARGTESLQVLILQLQKIEHPFFQNLVVRFQEILPMVTKLTPYFIKHDRDAEKALNDVNKRLSPLLSQLGLFVDFSDIAKSQNYSRATFDLARSFEFSGGWSFACEKKGQVVNDSPREKPFTVYTGSNMSGKSFELKKQFYMQLLAQSFGYVPCRDGNFSLYDSFHYLDRAATDSSRDLSAFGREIIDWKQAIAEFRKKPFICCDEGFSTTSPEDQYRLLAATDLYLRQHGAKFFLATHNETFISRMKNDQNVGLYHLHTTLDANKRVIYTHELRSGHGDSMALDVARDMGLPQEIIDRAAAYLQGNFPDIVREVEAHYPQIVPYALDEREKLKQEKINFERLFPERRGKNALLQLFSEDEEFKNMRAILLGGSGNEDRFWGMHSIWDYSPYVQRFALDTPRLTSQEVMERQQLFSLLAESGDFDAVATNEAAVRDILSYFLYSLHQSAGFLRFNQELNPFNTHHGDHRPDTLLSYLEFNRFLLGEEFPLEQEFEALKKLLQEREEIDGIFQRQDVSESARYCHMLGAAPVTDPEVLEALRALYGRYGQEYEAYRIGKDEAATGHPIDIAHLTPHSIHAFHAWLKRDHYSDFWNRVIWAGYEKALTRNVPNLREYPDTHCQTTEFLQIASQYHEENVEQWGGIVCRARIEALYNALQNGTIDISDHRQSYSDREALAHILDCVRGDQSRMPKTLSSGRTINSQTLNREIYDEAHRISDLLPVLPPCSLYDFDIEKLRPYLEPLIEYKVRSARRHHHEDGPMPQEEAFAIALHLLLHPEDAIGRHLSLLRGFDSVHLQQIANTLQADFATRFADKKDKRAMNATWGYVPQHILLSSGPKLRDLIASVYLKDGVGEMRAELLSLEQAYVKIVHQGSGIIMDGQHSSFCERYRDCLDILQNPSYKKSNESFSALKMLASWFLFQKYGTQYDTHFQKLFGDEQYAHGEKLEAYRRRFIQEVVTPNPDILAKYMQMGTDLSALAQQLDAYRQKHDIAFKTSRYDGNRDGYVTVKDTEAYAKILRGDVSPLRKHVDVLITDNVTSLGENRYGTQKLHEKLEMTTSLFVIGAMIKHQGQSKVTFNTSGDIRMDGAWNLRKARKDQIVSDIRFQDSERVKLINGANMSGKTFWLKKATLSLLWSMATGHAPAESATMPLVDQVIYLDRVLAKHSNNLSAFGNEITFWKDFLQLIQIQKSGVTVAMLDEIFSTTSPQYQAALASALISTITEQGTRTAVALHNHAMIDSFMSAHPEIAIPHHFSGHTEMSDGGVKLVADYQMQPGHVGSQAVEVARTLGFHDEILSIAGMIQ